MSNRNTKWVVLATCVVAGFKTEDEAKTHVNYCHMTDKHVINVYNVEEWPSRIANKQLKKLS